MTRGAEKKCRREIADMRKFIPPFRIALPPPIVPTSPSAGTASEMAQHSRAAPGVDRRIVPMGLDIDEDYDGVSRDVTSAAPPPSPQSRSCDGCERDGRDARESSEQSEFAKAVADCLEDGSDRDRARGTARGREAPSTDALEAATVKRTKHLSMRKQLMISALLASTGTEVCDGGDAPRVNATDAAEKLAAQHRGLLQGDAAAAARESAVQSSPSSGARGPRNARRGRRPTCSPSPPRSRGTAARRRRGKTPAGSRRTRRGALATCRTRPYARGRNTTRTCARTSSTCRESGSRCTRCS